MTRSRSTQVVPLVLMLLIGAGACEQKQVRLAKRSRVVCGECDKTISADIQTVLILKRDAEQKGYVRRSSFVSDYEFEDISTEKGLCDSCAAIKAEEEERERIAEQERLRRRKAAGKLVEAHGWIEGVSVAPIDYVIHFTLRNKTAQSLRIEFEIDCTNYSAPGYFLSRKVGSLTLGAFQSVQGSWEPTDAIESLREAIVQRGAQLSSYDIESLKPSKFTVDINLVDAELADKAALASSDISDKEIHAYLSGIWDKYEAIFGVDEAEAHVFIDASEHLNITILRAVRAWMRVEEENAGMDYFILTDEERTGLILKRLRSIGFTKREDSWYYNDTRVRMQS